MELSRFKVGRAIGRAFQSGVMLFTIIVSTFPIVWVIMSSFKTNGEILGGPFVLPSSINFDAYAYLFEEYDFGIYVLNSLIVSVTPTLLSIIFFSMAAYVIAKFKFPGSKLFFALFVVTLLVPIHSRTQPIFSLIIGLRLYDTRMGLILVYLSGGLAMSMFILKATFQAIPKELGESAEIDGAGFVRNFWTVHMPLAKTGITTAGVLMFLMNWNEFYYANTFAALTVVVIPGIVIYAFASKQVQQSMASTAVKG